jgi:hypothetical protein
MGYHCNPFAFLTAVSKNNTDDEIDPATVTLSEARGLSRPAQRCFAAAQHGNAATPAASPGVTLSRSEGSVALGDEMLRCAQDDK